MQDDFATYSRSLTSPAEEATAITPSNSADLAQVTRAVYVGKGGDLSVVMVSGATVVLPGVLGGVIYPLRVARVNATGTSADDLVALY